MFARCRLQRRNRHATWLKTVLIDSSVLAAEICAGPHNRLLRRQHCSSLCLQSEGHEHVANMYSALAHDFVGFLARVWPPQYSSPSLCEQSELQCCAPGLRRMFARCPLQLGCSKLKYQVDEDYAEKASSAALRGLKAQQVPSPGQRPGYQCINAYAL